jgi:hypothetical protein
MGDFRGEVRQDEGQKFVSPGWEWKEGRGVKEASRKKTAAWIAVT